MVAFLKSMDNKSKKVVIKGWTPPVIKYGDDSKFVKPKKRLDTC